MQSHYSSRSFAISLLVCILLLIALIPCYSVTMDASVGFDGNLKSRAWTPVIVKLSNTDNRQIDGVVEVLQSNSRVPSPTVSAKVVLPPNSKKCYCTYIRSAEYGEISVRFTSGFRTLAETQFPGDAVADTDRMVVSIGGKNSRLGLLSGETASMRTGQENTNSKSSVIHVGSIESGYLPDRPAAYEGVDVLVASELNPTSVDAKALQAIATWVASGGTLVVPTGTNYKAYQNSFYDELLPVTLTGGVKNITNPSSITRQSGSSPSGIATLAASVEKPGICTSVRYSGGIPVYARREYGSGCVIFLAFDPMSPPFRDWPGQVTLWKEILKGADPTTIIWSGVSEPHEQWTPMPGMRHDPQTGLASVLHNPSVKSPSLYTIMLFMLVYFVVLIPLNYFLLKRKRRLELAWVTMPAIVLVFTFGGYGIGYTMKGGQVQLNEITVIQGNCNSRYASKMTCASIFSPARRSYTINVADPYSLCRLSDQGRDSFPAVFAGEESTVENMDMAMWSSRSLESKSGTDLGGKIEGSVLIKGDRLSGTIRNNTALDLVNCRIICGNKLIAARDMKHGGSIEIHGVLQYHLHHKPFSVPFVWSVVSDWECPVLIGEVSSSKPVCTVSGGAEYDSRTVCVFALDRTPESSFEIPQNSIATRVISTSGFWVGRHKRSGLAVTIPKAGVYVGGFRLPRVPAGMAVSRITASSHANGKSALSSGLHMLLLNNQSGSWDAVRDGMSVSNADRYVGDNNEVTLKVTNSSPGPVPVAISLSAEATRR